MNGMKPFSMHKTEQFNNANIANIVKKIERFSVPTHVEPRMLATARLSRSSHLIGRESWVMAMNPINPEPDQPIEFPEISLISAISAESAAMMYLNSALDSPDLQGFSAVEASGEKAEFKSIGVEKIPFTNTQIVKFRQYYRDIPVYGSLVTVEMEPDNSLVSLNSSIGEPVNVDHLAAVSPKDALLIVQKDSKYLGQIDATPRLNYYYHETTSRWRLVYIIEDILVDEDVTTGHALPQYFDYVIDAASGEIVEKLPRTQTMARIPVTESAVDDLNDQRTFEAVSDDVKNKKEMQDISLNIHTHDFDFNDAYFQRDKLPGRYCDNPPTPWESAAVSAHANTTEVAKFLFNILQRNGLDGAGGSIVSSINCVYKNIGGNKEWHNAARIPGQMIYGQRKLGGKMISYASAKDIVSHELLHGLTDHTARLKYAFESGALNESYSDIFGCYVANSEIENVGNWNWEMGEELSESGFPMRDMANPARCGQPAHMDQYQAMPKEKDYGGVHVNSGIHNKAAHLIFTAKNEAGEFEFEPVTVIRLFYLTLCSDLSRNSKFADSRRGMEKWTKSFFRNDSNWQNKVRAVSRAFDAVGIF